MALETSSFAGEFRLAAVQMVSGDKCDANLQRAERLIAQAAADGAQMVALPEYFPLISGDDMAKVTIREEFGQGPIQQMLMNAARRYKIWIVGGTLPLSAQASDKVRNSSLVYAPDGHCMARYDKIHLFGFDNGKEYYDEAKTIEPGTEVVGVDMPFGPMAVSVCYDLRFPEFYRRFKSLSLIVVTAAFTYTTGRAHWEILLRARAIENQCYVLAAAQGGIHPSGRRTFGHSMLIDPWGEIVAIIKEGEGYAIGTLSGQRINGCRASLPALQHRVLT